MTEITVLVADDHAILREGIRSLLERQGDIRVIAEASNGIEACAKTRLYRPDIVLLDIAMPEMNGLEATRLIKQESPEVKIIILTQHDNREYIAPLLQAGASGYVLKRSGGREVITAIHQVYNEGAYLEASIHKQVLEGYASLGEETPNSPHLTSREKQVLEQLILGKSNKEIGLLLGISPKTVSVHRSSLMRKLNLHNSIELLQYVNAHQLFGLTSS